MNPASAFERSRRPPGWLEPAAWLFYPVIGLEILFMISPAGLYFYTLYGPVLNGLDRSAATAWLTGFFLPHLSTTRSLALNALPWIGRAFVLLGAAWFLAAAGQLYWNRFRRGGFVQSGLYAVCRHPQYVGLSLLGLGALLLWPRFLVLIAYVLMLFLYRALAGLEERRCEIRFGRVYRDYRTRVPAAWALISPRTEPATRYGNSWIRRSSGSLYAIGRIALAVLVAFGLREYTLSQITARYESHAAVLSPAPLDDGELLAVYRTALNDPGIRRTVRSEGEHPLVIHVLPCDWHLADLPMEIEPGTAAHDTPANFDRHRFKLLFSRPRTHECCAAGKDIIRSAYGLQPLLLARVDIKAGAVTAVEKPPTYVSWGDIPTPLY